MVATRVSLSLSLVLFLYKIYLEQPSKIKAGSIHTRVDRHQHIQKHSYINCNINRWICIETRGPATRRSLWTPSRRAYIHVCRETPPPFFSLSLFFISHLSAVHIPIQQTGIGRVLRIQHVSLLSFSLFLVSVSLPTLTPILKLLSAIEHS